MILSAVFYLGLDEILVLLGTQNKLAVLNLSLPILKLSGLKVIL